MNAPAAFPNVTPHNIDAEQALLGAVLVNNDAYGIVAGIMQPEYFYEPIHQTVWDAIANAIGAGTRVTTVTLRDYLPPLVMHRNADGSEVTLAQYIARIACESTTIINAPDYAAHIRDLWELRQIHGIASDAARPGMAPRDAIERAWGEMDAVRSRRHSSADEQGSIGKFAAIVASEVAVAPTGKDELVPSTGFLDLDRMIGGGYRAGRLYVFAGRPGMGKSVLAVASARRVAMRGFGVMFFALEIDGRETAARTIAADLALGQYEPVAYSHILSNDLTAFSRQRIAQSAERLKALPIEVDAGGGLSMFEIASKARMMIERWSRKGIKPGLIVIDYLGLVTPSDRYRGRKVDEAGEIARAGKDLAKRLGAGVLMLSQLNRQVEGRDDKRPQMSDLRDSGNIEEHADVVGLLYRPAYYDDRDPALRDGDPEAIERAQNRRNDLEISLGKNRLGPTVNVTLWCDIGSSSVDNIRRT